MKKRTNKELGVLVPQCMVDAIANEEITDDQVGKMVRAVIHGNMEKVKKDILARTLTASFVNEFKMVNRTRMESIKARRERNRESEQRRRNLAKISEKMLETAVEKEGEKHMGAHVRPCMGKNVKKVYINIPPISPKGDGGGAPPAGMDPGKTTRQPETIAELVDRIWERHPRKEGESRAKKKLATLMVKDPSAAREIDEGHRRWCETERWTKEGGRYAPRLTTWLNEEGWKDEPPPEKKQARQESSPAKCGMGL